jgi:hypothetical protein
MEGNCKALNPALQARMGLTIADEEQHVLCDALGRLTDLPVGDGLSVAVVGQDSAVVTRLRQ